MFRTNVSLTVLDLDWQVCRAQRVKEFRSVQELLMCKLKEHLSLTSSELSQHIRIRWTNAIKSKLMDIL
jgi:hypothetical protein